MKYPLAPICLFVYKRRDTLEKLIESLQKNDLAKESDLFIFSDAAGKPTDEEAVADVRAFCPTISGFKSVHTVFSETNKGLAPSVIAGVSQVVAKYDKVITLEDDLIVAPNFLLFMNEALTRYENNKKMFSVAGYTPRLKGIKDKQVYFTKRASSWGWGTWRDRWETVDWNVTDYESFMHDKHKQKMFNRMGSDLSGSLRKQREGKINSWAIRWVYEQFKRDQFTVHPVVSKVANEGFGDNATHTSKTNRNRFSTPLDTGKITSFVFPEQPYLEPAFVNQFTDRYSVKTRALYKLKDILNKFI